MAPSKVKQCAKADSARYRSRHLSLVTRDLAANERGFTLVELIMVMALLGMVFGLVWPRLGGAGTAATASRQLIGMIRTLYVTAPAGQKIYRLYLDMDARTYWAMTVDPDGERAPSEPSLAQRMSLPRDVRFNDMTTVAQGKVAVGRAMIQFFPVGRTERSVIHLSDESQSTLTLVLNPLTGMVQVLDGYKEPKPAAPVPDQYRTFLLLSGQGMASL